MRRALAAAAVVLLLAGAAAAAPAPPATRAEADARTAAPSSRERDRALAAWAKRAPLDDVLWVLRHGPDRLGAAEAGLVEAARRRLRDDRSGLARQLGLRAALLEPPRRDDLLTHDELERLRPRASVFRVAALLPETGDYADFATRVHRGLLAGLAVGRAADALPIEVLRVGTGDEDAARAVTAHDSASRHCAVTVGSLLSVPTLAVAAASRALGTPLISPTATDESIGRIGPAISQVGPGQRERARVLAGASIRAGQRVAMVAHRAAHEGAFARAFAEACESSGAEIVRRERYAEGGGDFRAIARSLKAAQAQVAFWEGDPGEAQALVRALAAEGVRLQVVGGAGLAPEQHHAHARALMEGVMWVGEDWTLEPATLAVADSLARAQGESDGAGSLWIRGFLAGRRIAAVIDGGARTGEALIRGLLHPDPRQREGGFLDCTRDGARLPVFTARRGKSVEWDGW